jgi:hypothetical protein
MVMVGFEPIITEPLMTFRALGRAATIHSGKLFWPTNLCSHSRQKLVT